MLDKKICDHKLHPNKYYQKVEYEIGVGKRTRPTNCIKCDGLDKKCDDYKIHKTSRLINKSLQKK